MPTIDVQAARVVRYVNAAITAIPTDGSLTTDDLEALVSSYIEHANDILREMGNPARISLDFRWYEDDA